MHMRVNIFARTKRHAARPRATFTRTEFCPRGKIASRGGRLWNAAYTHIYLYTCVKYTCARSVVIYSFARVDPRNIPYIKGAYIEVWGIGLLGAGNFSRLVISFFRYWCPVGPERYGCRELVPGIYWLFEKDLDCRYFEDSWNICWGNLFFEKFSGFKIISGCKFFSCYL